MYQYFQLLYVQKLWIYEFDFRLFNVLENLFSSFLITEIIVNRILFIFQNLNFLKFFIKNNRPNAVAIEKDKNKPLI